MTRNENDPMDAALDELFGSPGSGDQETAPVDQTHPDSRFWVWDIETGPLAASKVKKYYTPPEPPAEFDPSTVKCGNIGGPESEKGQAKIAAAAAAHQELIEQHEQVEIGAWEEFYDRCALNPVTGRVITSQYLFLDRGDEVLVDESGWGANTEEAEKGVLEGLWERVDHTRTSGGRIIGYNLGQFDFPFAVQRSYHLGITIPKGLLWKNRYLADMFVDLYDIWRVGRTSKFTDAAGFKLSEVCAFLGLKAKTLDSGADFWKLYKSTKTRAKAIEYAANDVRIEAQLARRLGVVT